MIYEVLFNVIFFNSAPRYIKKKDYDNIIYECTYDVDDPDLGLNIPKPKIPSVEESNRCLQKSRRPMIFHSTTLSWSFLVGEERVDAMTLFQFGGGRQVYGKTMKTLIPKGVFIRFCSR